MAQAAIQINEAPPMGHNNPPLSTPFDLSREEIEDLFEEAKNWLDGEGVQTQADADGVSKLLEQIRKAVKTADERRVEENRPFDEGKAAVQSKYAPLIADTKTIRGKAVLAAEACKRALTPFLTKQEAEKRAAAELARKAADEERARAEAAVRAARASDLQAQEDAEAQLRGAQKLEADAKRAENDKAQAKGGARAIGLRSTWKVELTDLREAAKHYWNVRPDEFRAFLVGLATQDVGVGKREIPGFTVVEKLEAV